MDTYFIRHCSELDIDENTFDYLMKNNYIGIHFPNDINGKLPEKKDFSSLNPNDYKGAAKKAMNALISISNNGGYVCAVYRNFLGCKIGIVKKNSSIELVEGKWGTQNELQGRTAILKCVKVENHILLEGEKASQILSIQPRQGTFCKWYAIGNRIENILNGILEIKLNALSTAAQEILCVEYLRAGMFKIDNYSFVLETQIIPTGRTLKNIDILGLNFNGNIIAAQVTYSDKNAITSKIAKLKLIENTNTIIKIMFCNCPKPSIDDGVFIYPIHKVFEDFIKTVKGKRWIDAIV